MSDALASEVHAGSTALLLLCAEWGKIAIALPSASPILERTDLQLTSPIVRWMESQNAATQWGELAVLPQLQGVSSREREMFDQLDTEVLVPLQVDNALTGIIVLGAKRSGDAYRLEELKLLSGVARAVAMAFENSRLYAVEQAKVAELKFISEMKSERIMAITHQLKTPIAAVKASAEMLWETQAELPEVRLRMVNSIVRGVDSLDRLVTELTEYGKMQNATIQLNRVESDLRSIVSDTCVLLQPLFDDKGIRLQLEAPPTLPWIMADPHRVQQILSNLIANAIQFTRRGGEISVRLRRDGERLLTQVQDKGPGIPEAQQGWVFEAFYGASDTSQRRSGSGLGLAIAKALTELHGGNIWLESQEGKGSTFSFSLPLSPQGGAQPGDRVE